MKFKLYEGRRTVPHTKAEMNSKRNGSTEWPFVTAKVVENDTDSGYDPLGLGEFVLGFWIWFSMPSPGTGFSVNILIDPKTGKIERGSIELEIGFPLPSEYVKGVTIAFSLGYGRGFNYIKDYYNTQHISMNFKNYKGIFTLTDIRRKDTDGQVSTAIEVCAPNKFTKDTLPKFSILIFSKLKQAFPDYVQALMEETLEAMSAEKEKTEIEI